MEGSFVVSRKYENTIFLYNFPYGKPWFFLESWICFLYNNHYISIVIYFFISVSSYPQIIFKGFLYFLNSKRCKVFSPTDR